MIKEIKSYPPGIWEESQRLTLDRSIMARRWTLGEPTSEAFAHKRALTWDTLSSDLADKANQYQNPIERSKFVKLTELAQASQSIFTTLSDYLRDDRGRLTDSQRKKLGEVLGDRQSEVSGDTYPSHGARCASYLVDMGITSKVAFLTAGLHDISELLSKDINDKLSNVALFKIRKALGRILEPNEMDSVLESLRTFHEADLGGQETAKTVSETLRKEGLPFGHEFSLDQFAKMQKKLWGEHTSKVEVSGDADDQNKFEFAQTKSKGAKFDSLLNVLGKGARQVSRHDAERKNISPQISISSELAYLAAALDHSYFPKINSGKSQGRDLMGEQQIALSIYENHLPELQAYGDPMRRIALEVVFRAFMPEKFGNLYKVARKMSNQSEGGDYFELSAKLYGKKIREVVGVIQRTSGGEVLSDAQWEERIRQFMSNPSTRHLLGPNEIYCPGYYEVPQDTGDKSPGPPQHFRVVDMKSAASIMDKTVKQCSSPDKVARFTPELQSLLQGRRFGTRVFWEYVLPRQQDILRTMIVFGSDVARASIAGLVTEFDSMQYSENPREEHEPGHLNCARTLFNLQTSEARKNELVQHKGDGWFNIVFAVPHKKGLEFPDMEMKIIPTEILERNEYRASDTHRIVYKFGDRLDEELENGASDDERKAYKTDIAALFLKREQQYREYSQDSHPKINEESNRKVIRTGNVYIRRRIHKQSH